MLSPSFTVEAASRNGRGEGGLYSSVYKASEIESTGFGEICGCRAVSLAHSGSNRIMASSVSVYTVVGVYIGGRKKKRSGGEGGGGKRGGGGRRDKGNGEREGGGEREEEER